LNVHVGILPAIIDAVHENKVFQNANRASQLSSRRPDISQIKLKIPDLEPKHGINRSRPLIMLGSACEE